MISAGNDIVDLNSFNIQRAARERFYTKILSPAEIAEGKAANSFNLDHSHYVWLLWSIKEAAYKFCKRDCPDMAFSPPKILVRQLAPPSKNRQYAIHARQIEHIGFLKEACWCSMVSVGATSYYSRSIVTAEAIYTVVNNTDCFENIHWGIKHINNNTPAHQSESVRHFMLKKLEGIYTNANLAIAKSQTGYPVLKVDGSEANLPVSFSHHDGFVAYAFLHAL